MIVENDAGQFAQESSAKTTKYTLQLYRNCFSQTFQVSSG